MIPTTRSYLTSYIQKALFFILILGVQLSFAQTPVAMNGKLKVNASTKKLVSACGNPVQLRGVSTHSLQDFIRCYNNSSFEALVGPQWGADVIRLANYANEYSEGGVYTPAQWKTNIDTWVDAAGAKGLYVIIDWHTLTEKDPNVYINQAKDFWAYMSAKHAGKSHVIYEICNEPNGVGWDQVRSYANTIIPIIRANDPETVIIVGTPGFSSELDGPISNPATGTNLMYAYHFYSGTHMGRLDEFKSKSTQIPVFVSEWGTTNADGGGSPNTSGSQQWIDYLNTAQISWCNWAFADKNETSSILPVGGCQARNWTTTTASGTYLKSIMSSPADKFISCGVTNCKSPNLGPDVSLCGTTGGITLNTGLSAANKTFVWKQGSTTLSGTGPTLNVTQAGTYSVTIDTAGCQKTDQIVVSAVIPSVTFPATNLCTSTTATLDAGVSTPGVTYTYAWTLDNVATGGNTKTLSINKAGKYAVTVSTTGCTSSTGSVTVTSSLPTVTGEGTICKGESAALAATGTGPFNWFTQSSGGTSVFTGNTYSPKPDITTTYYVGVNSGVTSTFKPADPGVAYWNDVKDYGTTDKQLLFTAAANVTLTSVDVSSPTSQSVTVNVSDNSNSSLVKTVTVTVPAGQSAIVLNASLTSGKTYRIDAVGTTGMLNFRQNSGSNSSQAAVYPQTIANVGTLTSNASYSLGWSLFFNVKVTAGGSSSCVRVPVEVTVQICSGIEEEEIALAGMQIYPNPFENGFNIQLGSNHGVVQRIEITDMEGRIVDTRQGDAISSSNLMGEGLHTGHYFVRIISANKVAVRPIIKLK